MTTQLLRHSHISQCVPPCEVDAGKRCCGNGERDVLIEIGELRVAVVGDALHGPGLQTGVEDPAKKHWVPLAGNIYARLDEVEWCIYEVGS